MHVLGRPSTKVLFDKMAVVEVLWRCWATVCGFDEGWGFGCLYLGI